ncbi:MAG: excinuclease ABC subunit UvrC [Verrucomicrobiae bacterium]|nr:excinuclease ABC subunit UvrC [Verrucomicrobiae bacterium]
MTVSPSIQEKIAQLQNRPGIYLIRDRLGRVIYVGKARSLARRVRSYFQPARYSQLDPKTRALVDSAADLECHTTRSEAEAVLLEGKLIKHYKPRYNILFRDDKRFLLLKLTCDPFPRFVLTRLEKPDGCRYFGPFPNAAALRNTLDYIRRTFHLRSCPPSEPGKSDYRHCHNDLLQHCAAPCVGRVTREEYARWVERACLLLEGKDEEALQEMETEMRHAAAAKDFERAAALRDALYDLRTTVKSSRQRFRRDMPVRAGSSEEIADLARALDLAHAPKVIEGFDISHIHGRHAVGSMVQFVAGRPARANYRHFIIRGDEGTSFTKDAGGLISSHPSLDAERLNDDVASIREIVGRRYARLLREKKPLPNLILIDGGKGQLHAALAALDALGARPAIAGLAKQDEEIFLPGKPEPIRLPSNAPALHLLQRVRDESHRFANSRHEAWRRKQIRNSILDDFPGIGEKRKQALLKRFGSVKLLRDAPVEAVMEVEGFGRASAEKLLRFLQKNGEAPARTQRPPRENDLRQRDGGA